MPSFSYQWQQCDSAGQNCFNIAGAISSTYQPTAGDVGHMITVVVTASNTAGSAYAAASPVGPVAAVPTPPQNQVAPGISGSPTVGQTLTGSAGTWTGNPSFSYQWQQCDGTGQSCFDLGGVTAMTYQPASVDVGQTITVVVTATNTAGSASAAAAPVGPIAAAAAPPQNQVAPTIGGAPTAGQTLTASAGTWTGNPSFSYQWQQCDNSGQSCFDLGGGTGSSYQPSANDVGHMVTVVVTATNTGGSATAAASPVGPIDASPQNQVAPTIGGVAMAGQTLTASPGTWSGSPCRVSLTSGSSATAPV